MEIYVLASIYAIVTGGAFQLPIFIASDQW
jgi:hypothetical protein